MRRPGEPMTADEVRQALRDTAHRRMVAGQEHREATAVLARYLREARETSVSHAEAARLAGLSRNGAYKLMRDK